jgi:hypothetical protein
MAHYAEVNKDNIVVNVIVGRDETSGTNWEEHYTRTMGSENGTRFIRTSYNTSGGVHAAGGIPFRKNYASIGGVYDPVRDAFYTQKPYASWVLNDETCRWEPPVTPPSDFIQDGLIKYVWDESTISWKLKQ